MNTMVTQNPPEPTPPEYSLRLLRRLHAIAPQFAISIGLLIGWQEDEIAFRRAAAADAAAVDDPLEALHGELEAALANDSAALRGRIQSALTEVHTRTTRLSKKLAP